MLLRNGHHLCWVTHHLHATVDGRHRVYVYRLASVSTLLIQLCISFRKHIQRWFGAVHKTARDDRYLIGEILLNYQPDMEP
jgi:hypothetical protein